MRIKDIALFIAAIIALILLVKIFIEAGKPELRNTPQIQLREEIK